jgi:integrase/recombinase XerD
MNMREDVDMFLLNAETQNLSPNTLRDYRSILRIFAFWVEKYEVHDVKRIEPNDIRLFVRDKMKEGVSPYTVNKYIRTLRAFFNFLLAEERILRTPMRNISLVKAPERIFREIDREALRLFCAQFDKNTFPGIRNWTIARCVFDTGARAGEILGIRMENVHLREQYLITTGKGGKEKVIPFGKQLRKDLMRYLNSRQAYLKSHQKESSWLFPSRTGKRMLVTSLSHLFRRTALKAGLNAKNLHPHAFRHNFAIQYLLNGGDLASLQKEMGHSNPATTSRYATMVARHLVQQHQRFAPLDRLNEE